MKPAEIEIGEQAAGEEELHEPFGEVICPPPALRAQEGNLHG
ncbi:unnamed protein product [Dibothriocephalus latus]|uniref:Uncharacterized protein n=1 Tax=Dibothriocephalus latus TaxID=60516 RepID=A0A3P7NY13_DIBLA|nr:unnamed protein product [Dibothriocephalus latus]